MLMVRLQNKTIRVPFASGRNQLWCKHIARAGRCEIAAEFRRLQESIGAVEKRRSRALTVVETESSGLCEWHRSSFVSSIAACEGQRTHNLHERQTRKWIAKANLLRTTDAAAELI